MRIHNTVEGIIAETDAKGAQPFNEAHAEGASAKILGVLAFCLGLGLLFLGFAHFMTLGIFGTSDSPLVGILITVAGVIMCGAGAWLFSKAPAPARAGSVNVPRAILVAVAVVGVALAIMLS